MNNSQKTLDQIQQNIQKQPENYLKLAGNLGITINSLQEVIEKGLPENVADIKINDGKRKYSVSTSNKFGDLIQHSSKIWNSLRVKMPLTEENKSKIVKDLLENFKNADTQLYNNFIGKVSENQDYQQLQQVVIREYTGNLYSQINSILTSNDPVILSAMREYLNICIKAYQDGNVGKVFHSQQTLYRNFRLPKELLSLYKQNSFIYFTNMTSTSLVDIEGFGQPDASNYGMKFQISLLSLKEQIKWNFYTGIEVSTLSYYPSEQEVLLLPYQLFQITNVKQNGKDKFIISLKEVNNKQILKNIITPLQMPSKPSQPLDKKGLQEIIILTKQKMSQKQEQLKEQKIAAISQFQNQAKEFKEKNKIHQINIQDSQLIDKEISSFKNSETNQYFNPEGYQNNLNDEEEEKTEELVFDNNNQIANIKSEDKSKLLEISENFDDFINKLSQQKNVNPDNIKEDNQQVENILKEYILVNIEEETSKKIIEESQQQTKNQEVNLIQEISLDKNFLSSLNIQKKKDFKKNEFLLLLMNKSYEQVNQQALFNDKIPICLQNKFLQRFALSSQDNFFYKVYFNPQNIGLSLQDLKNQIIKIFFNKYPAHKNNYLDLTCVKDQLEDSKTQCYSFIFQTYISLNEMVDLIKTLPVKIIESTKVQKHKYIQLSDQFFDNRGNMNYLKQIYPQELRGNLPYNFPNRCVRLGLKVLNLYDNGNNDWLSMNNSLGEWAAVYTWISETIHQSFDNFNIFGFIQTFDQLRESYWILLTKQEMMSQQNDELRNE